MKKFSVFLIVIAVVIFTSCDKNKGDDFTYGDYPDSVNKNDEDDYNYVKKDADTVKKDDDSYTSTDNDTVSDPDDDTFILTDEDNFTLPDDDNFTLPDEDNLTLPDEDNYTLPDEDSFILPDEDTYVEQFCKNDVVDEGEICEPSIPKQCHALNPELYQSGWATCKDDCSGWIMTSCVEYPCSEKPDTPDSAFLDSNCDGIDGNIIESVFVDGINGINTNSGEIESPVATIEKGLEIAENAGKKHVLVSFGTYLETIVLKSNISIHGGYSGHPDWYRSSMLNTNILGNRIGIEGEWVGMLTLSFITVTSSDAVETGESSYGMIFRNCQEIVLDNVKIIAGKGSNGTDGDNGTVGFDGTDGFQGNPGCESSGFITCGECNAPEGGSGGVSPCGRNGGKGGKPGRSSENGLPGENGTGSDNNGGEGGIGNNYDDMCLFTPGLDTHGDEGLSGSFGAHGIGGEDYGIFDEYYVPSGGLDGENGNDGQGGGGGGGGKGGTNYCKSYGSSGGGGGGGGCGGTAGEKGTGGGGSFGLWLYNSNVRLENCRIESSVGGKGGDAGQGAIGGLGGLGGNGGPYGGSGDQDDGGCGGWGGNGGNGGRGGHGGGGGGGPSVPLVIIKSVAEGQFQTTYKIGNGGTGGASNANHGKTGISAQYIELF